MVRLRLHLWLSAAGWVNFGKLICGTPRWCWEFNYQISCNSQIGKGLPISPWCWLNMCVFIFSDTYYIRKVLSLKESLAESKSPSKNRQVHGQSMDVWMDERRQKAKTKTKKRAGWHWWPKDNWENQPAFSSCWLVFLLGCLYFLMIFRSASCLYSAAVSIKTWFATSILLFSTYSLWPKNYLKSLPEKKQRKKNRVMRVLKIKEPRKTPSINGVII